MINRTYISKFNIYERDKKGELKLINCRYGTATYKGWLSNSEQVFEDIYQRVCDAFPGKCIELVFFKRLK